MNVLFIGGIFPENEINRIMKESRGSVQFAANNFQINLIDGLKKSNIETTIVSAPFIGSFPFSYKKIFYKTRSNSKNIYYASFMNAFGIRNVSRYCGMKKIVKNSIDLCKNYTILVYSAHVPNIKLAYYLKRINPQNKIVLVLPDLPQYMLLAANNYLYHMLKKIDILLFKKYEKKCDGYILLTKYMNEFVNKNKIEYIIVEGIVSDDLGIMKHNNPKLEDNNKIITYTGGLNYKYGIKNLIDAFMLIDDNNVELHIYGSGEAEDYIKCALKNDSRIRFYGQVSNKDSKLAQNKSFALINPRQNIGEYTKYSFPSKNLEYLSTGRPVIAYYLDGMPEEYRNVVFSPCDNSIESLKEEIIHVLNMNEIDLKKYKERVFDFLDKKNTINTGKKIKKYLSSL